MFSNRPSESVDAFLRRRRLRTKWNRFVDGSDDVAFGLPYAFREIEASDIGPVRHWHAEEKLDGLPLQILSRGGRVRLLCLEYGTDVTDALPHIVEAATGALPGPAAIVGELYHDKGLLHLETLLGRETIEPRLPPVSPEESSVYLFDVLGFDGGFEGRTPYLDRRRLLESVTAKDGPLLVPAGGASDAESVFETVCAKGGEGVVLRRPGSLLGTRALKLKVWRSIELEVMSVTARREELTLVAVGSEGVEIGIAIVPVGCSGMGDPGSVVGRVVEIEPVFQRRVPLFLARRFRPNRDPQPLASLPWQFRGLEAADPQSRAKLLGKTLHQADEWLAGWSGAGRVDDRRRPGEPRQVLAKEDVDE